MVKSHGHDGLHNIGEGDGGEWMYQVRVDLSDSFALAARMNMDDPRLKPLKDVMDRHGMRLQHQYDAMVNFCRKAEDSGETDTVLYRWTRATIDKPGKAEETATRFTVYTADGDQIYPKALADAVETDLLPLKESGMITRINKFDSNPANNPQAPKRFL